MDTVLNSENNQVGTVVDTVVDSVVNNRAIVTRLRQACNVKNDADLARYLGTTTSAVSTWKTALNPPFKACFDVFNRTGVSLEWLLTGKAPNADSSSNLPQANMPIFTQEMFVEKFLGALSYGFRSELFKPADDYHKIELIRMGKLLYNDTIGQMQKLDSSEGKGDEKQRNED